jgi:hypothetical protein
MIIDSEIRIKGMKALIQELGETGAVRFITLIVREPFDYTQWQDKLWEDLSIEELSKQAMDYISTNENDKNV